MCRYEGLFYLFVDVGPYGETPFDELSADEAELNVPNGPILLNADDMRLVIPKGTKKKRMRGSRERQI